MPVTTTTAVRQLSDGNPIGTVLGQSTTDLIGFYNVSPIAQPAGAQQAAIARGNAAGVVATILSATQSPSSITTITSAEKTMTLVTAAGSVFQVATTDLVFVNKPTSQAGIGVGNVRASAGNTLAVTFSNFTAATLTPTASQSYSVLALRGFNTATATLTPAAVAANTIAEQQFAVAGIRPGEMVQVNKPASQAGLDVVGCRAVASGVLGITFANVTAATITPTAAEVYNVVSLSGIDAVNNDLVVQTLQSPAAIVLNTAIEQSLTVTGLAATDTAVFASKPTAQTGLAAIVGLRVASANTLGLTFGNFTAATLTPTPAETYSVTIKRPAPVAPLVMYTQTLTPVSVAANTTAEQTFTVTGVAASSVAFVNKPSATPGLGIAGVRVSAANTVAINFCNVTGAAIVPPAEAYIIGNFQLPVGDASSTWMQTASTVDQAQNQLANALRLASVSLGLVAGA